MPDHVLEMDKHQGDSPQAQIIGRVRTASRVNLRPNGPSRNSPPRRTLDTGTDLFVVEIVEGETVGGINRWYRTRAGDFVWSGACDPFEDWQSTDALEQDEPERPERSSLPLFAEPEFQTVRNVMHKVRGPRPGGLEGLIVHFDAARTQPDSDASSRGVLRYGADRGYHYGAISRTGRIYLPQGFSWDSWGYHAGKSRCPETGRESVSQFYVGFELNNPGQLYQAREDGVFCPWFNAKRDKRGRVVLDENGRCRRISEHGEWFREYELRYAEGENIDAGWYLPFTREQFDALADVCLWLSQSHADTFSLDRVFGHDEVSPGRKSDPGGALGWPDQVMTMPDFRRYLTDHA